MGQAIVLFLIVCGTIWASVALAVDLRIAVLRLPCASVFCGAVVAILWKRRADAAAMAIVLGMFVVVLLWWFHLEPTNDRDWQADVARLPWTGTTSDSVTIHNVRDCHYATEMRYTCAWGTRTIPVGDITGVDLFLTHWGSPLIAHVIVSFVLKQGAPLAMSIEARKTVGQEYSSILGFFRQYNLIYLAAEESDIVRVRTNYRKGEDVTLYHTLTKPSDAQRLFLQYVHWIQQVSERPEWYNALTANCSLGVTSYLARAKVGGISAWDWRTVLNGEGDRMLYELGDLATGGLPFEELRRRAFINPVAKTLGDNPDFSKGIREGRPGFAPQPGKTAR